MIEPVRRGRGREPPEAFNYDRAPHKCVYWLTSRGPWRAGLRAHINVYLC
jgi:hypothetical protein